MENKKIILIKELLSHKLTQTRKKMFGELEVVQSELKKQWTESKLDPVEEEIKQQIWIKVAERCEVRRTIKPNKTVWYAIAASIALVFMTGTYFFLNDQTKVTEEFVSVVAEKSKVYTLPDSSKVWMQPGCSLRFAKDFNSDRRVWLKGNSLFEVRKRMHSTFRVYINHAFIEVRGTCFLVKQDKPTQNEITLFSGLIDFNIDSKGIKTRVEPLQKIVYDSETLKARVETVENLNWKNGKYNFNEMPLEQLVSEINKLYNANIVLSKDIRKQSAFTGSIRFEESLEDVIEKICFTLNLNKDINDDEIVIHN